MISIKSSNISVFSIILDNLNIKELTKNIKEKKDQAEDIFINSNFIINFKNISNYENFEIFLEELIETMQILELKLIGFSNINLSYEKMIKDKNISIVYEKDNKKVDKNNLYPYKETNLRSGQELIFDNNSIILNGNVKLDAEIKSAGDVIVLGVLSGKVFAGIHGDKKSKIIATNFQANVVSIAGKTIHFEERNRIFGKSVIITLDERNDLNFKIF